ncbi:hypothetical protein NDU88_006515, partial [Pleurodeles waltl]
MASHLFRCLGLRDRAGVQTRILRVPISAVPPLPRSMYFSLLDRNLISTEISALVKKGAVVKAPRHPSGFVSPVFLVDKKGGGSRLILNLKDFNVFLLYRHFKMEGIHLLRDILQEGDW